MPNKIKLPITMAGEIGASDVTDALNRRYMAIPFTGNTTGIVYGGDSTTGFKPFDYAVTMEKLVCCYKTTSTVASTTAFKITIYDGATVVFSVKKAAAMVKNAWVTVSTAPASADIATTGKFRVVLAKRHAKVRLLSAFFTFKSKT